jgi:hypothetical protein
LAIDDNKKGDGKPLTREQYRKLKLQQEEDFEARDKRRVQVEREYARKHQQGEPIAQPEPQPTTRAHENVKPAEDFKTPRWHRINRKLNWTITILILLMVVVFLVLFFVN